MKILDANEGLVNFFIFFVFPAFLEFWWYSNKKYVLNAADLYLVPQTITERLKVYFFHNQLLKFSYFHDFDGRERTIYAYFPFYFVHISSENILTQLFITSKWPQSVDLSNKPCNHWKPNFRRSYMIMALRDTIWEKNTYTFVRVRNFHGRPVYPKFMVSGLKYSQHPYNNSMCWDFWKKNLKKSYRRTNKIRADLPPPLGSKCR